MSVYLSSQWQLTYAAEATYGAAPNGALTAQNVLGVFENATLPDPEFEHTQHWGNSGTSDRNFYVAYRGRARCQGSIPDIVLLDGRPLFLPICDAIDHNEIQGALSKDNAAYSDELADARSATASDVTLLPAAPVATEDGFLFGSYAKFSAIAITIGTVATGAFTITWKYWNGSAWTALAGVSDGTVLGAVSFGQSGTVSWTVPSDWDTNAVNGKEMYWVFADLTAFTNMTQQPLGTEVTSVTGVSSSYNHVMPGYSATRHLSSVRMLANFMDTSATPANGLMRWFVGGKINRATYHCEEGQMLRMSLDDMQFKMPYFEDDDATNISPWYDSNIAQQTFTWPTTEPYYFSYGALSFKLAHSSLTEVAIPSVRNFRLDVVNNLEPKYYIMTNTEKVPYQIYEGNRQYRMNFTVDLVDAGSFDRNSVFLELLNQGMDTTLKGVALKLVFTRGANDYIEFRTPIDYYPQAGGDEQGAMIVRAPHPIDTRTGGVVSVQVEMVCRNVGITVVDAIAGGSYPI